MTSRIVLAYSGGSHSSAAIGWLRERYQADVITLTVDVGQARDLEEIRERALTLGAVRAHVVDRRDAFAAAAMVALRGGAAATLSATTVAGLALPVIAQALAEVAAIETTVMVAHAATGSAADLLDAAVAAATTLPVVCAERPARAHGVLLPTPSPRWSASRHLLCRPVAGTSPAGGSSVDVAFVDGLPVAVAGVAFPPAELLECLSVLGGGHGVGRLTDGVEAPAAAVLHAAYAVLPQPTGVVRLALSKGRCLAAALEPRHLQRPTS